MIPADPAAAAESAAAQAQESAAAKAAALGRVPAAEPAAAHFHPGTGGVGYPSCVYCPDPKYSEEARKAKYQGTVVLQAVITPDGRATKFKS